MSATATRPQCEMRRECTESVTHIGSKGYIYCATHGTERRAYGTERTRKMRPWELRWITEGRALPSYRPGPEPKEARA